MATYLHFFEAENTGLGQETKRSIQEAFGAADIALGELGTISSGDILFLIGHGSPASLTGNSPADLAKILTDAGLRQPVQIMLYSCDTGFGGAPYALELKIQLVQRGVLCSVVAPTGPIGGDFDVHTEANMPFYGTGHLPQYNQPAWVR